MIKTSQKKKIILIADDDANFVETVFLLLSQKMDATFVKSYTGDKTITEALKHKPDLIIIDVNMPPINGIDIINKIQSKLPNTKYLMVSSHKLNDLEDSISTNELTKLEKPIVLSKLFKKTLELLNLD